jgi:N-carbamoylputrescine amidase
LCYETHFPEVSTVMTIQGADILFMPHASPRGTPKEKSRSWLRHLPARAFDNSLFVVACNQVGKTRAGFDFPGVILALDPTGMVIHRYAGEEEQMICTEFSMDMLHSTRRHKMKFFIPNRRPDLYAAVAREKV